MLRNISLNVVDPVRFTTLQIYCRTHNVRVCLYMMRKLPNLLYLGHASYVCSTVFQIILELVNFVKICLNTLDIGTNKKENHGVFPFLFLRM